MYTQSYMRVVSDIILIFTKLINWINIKNTTLLQQITIPEVQECKTVISIHW